MPPCLLAFFPLLVGNMFHPKLKPESYIQIEFSTEGASATDGNTSPPQDASRRVLSEAEKKYAEISPDERKAAFHKCSSKIRTVVDDYIHIDHPFSATNENIEFTPELDLRVMFSTETGTYAFDTQIVEVLPNNTLVLAPPAEVYECNRQYWRFDSSIWVRYRVIPREQMAGKLATKKGYAMTVNISGGGILLAAQDELPIGAILELEIDVPTLPETILALGKIVHTQVDSQSNRPFSGQGIEFILIEESDRNILVKYIFEQERLLRRCNRDVVKQPH